MGDHGPPARESFGNPWRLRSPAQGHPSRVALLLCKKLSPAAYIFVYSFRSFRNRRSMTPKPLDWMDIVTAAVYVVNAWPSVEYSNAEDLGRYPIAVDRVAQVANGRGGTECKPIRDARMVSQAIMVDHARKHSGTRYTIIEVAKYSRCSRQAVLRNWHQFHSRHEAEFRLRNIYALTVEKLQRDGFILKNLEQRYIIPDAD